MIPQGAWCRQELACSVGVAKLELGNERRVACQGEAVASRLFAVRPVAMLSAMSLDAAHVWRELS